MLFAGDGAAVSCKKRISASFIVVKPFRCPFGTLKIIKNFAAIYIKYIDKICFMY